MEFLKGIVGTVSGVAKTGVDVAVDVAKGGLSLFGGIFSALFKAFAAEDPVANNMIGGVENFAGTIANAGGKVAQSAGHAVVDLGANTVTHGLPDAVRLAGDPTRSIS